MLPCRLIQVLPLLWIHAVTPFPFGLFQPGRIYGNGSSNKKRENSSRQMLSSSYTQLYSPPPSDPPEIEIDPEKIPGKAAPISSEYVQAEWKETDDAERLSHIDVISSMTSASNGVFEAKRTTESSSSEEPLKQAHRVQQAYREWCEFYDKTQSKERLGVFASNFLTVQEYHERTGRPLVLNELADLTEEEYKMGNYAKKRAKAPVEDRICEAYRQWCAYYDKTYDEGRLQIFAANFVMVEEYHVRTNEFLVLNEFADMTEQEYTRHLNTAAEFVSPENTGPVSKGYDDPFSQSNKDTVVSDNDPITSYLEPVRRTSSPSNFRDSKPQVSTLKFEEPKQPIPKEESQILQSDQIVDPVISSDSKDYENDMSATTAAIASLKQTVASLTEMVKSLAAAVPSAPEPKAQPLESLVIDVLQQQDSSIAQLEESIEGFHEIQKQSSDLIELVSNNQRKMMETIEALQVKFSGFQQEKKQTENEYISLLNRIEKLEGVVTKFDRKDPVRNRSLVLSPGTAVRARRIELKPNIPPIGHVQRNLFP